MNITYRYILKEQGAEDIADLSRQRSINLKKIKADQLNVFDEWQVIPLYEDVFLSKPFEDVFGKDKFKLKKGEA